MNWVQLSWFKYNLQGKSFKHLQVIYTMHPGELRWIVFAFVLSDNQEPTTTRAGDRVFQIKAFNPNYITEIDHIARGAEISEPLWVYALNAGTELASSNPINECTAIVFPQHSLLGQTWDWAKALEDNFLIMEIHHRHRFLSIALLNSTLLDIPQQRELLDSAEGTCRFMHYLHRDPAGTLHVQPLHTLKELSPKNRSYVAFKQQWGCQ